MGSKYSKSKQWLEMAFDIHAVMQNTNDFNVLVTLAVENQVPADVIFTIAFSNIIASGSHPRLMRNRMKTGIKHGKILIPLLPAPFPLGKTADGFQVLHGFGGETK